MTYSFFTNIPLALSLLLMLAISTSEIPLWAGVFSFVFVLWRFGYEKFNIPKLSPKITPIFGLMFFVIVYMQYRTIFGQEESTTVLVGLTAITILNFQSSRDLKFLVLLGFLLVVLKSVFSLDFVWVLPALVSFFGLWVTLLPNFKFSRMRYVFRTFLISVPLLVLLFVLFPRLVLFQVNKVNQIIPKSGFSDDLNPGSISQLAISNQMVFRAQFLDDREIIVEDLYWRGSVLKVSDGLKWRKGEVLKVTNQTQNSTNSALVRYQIVQEPLGFRNLFVLDKPIKISKSTEPVQMMSHSTYALTNSQQQLLQFDGEAVFDKNYFPSDDSVEDKIYTKYTKLPERTQAWVDEQKQKYKRLDDRYLALIKFFQNSAFVYTLQPGSYDNDLDEFLFVRRKGFCEHYAAAFGTLARALEIPSRVVIGYHGGLYNELSDFWKVSQKDAHAWVEVGLDSHWRRIDPTGLVSPLRIRLGSEEFFSMDEVDQMLYAKNNNYKNSNELRQTYIRLIKLFDSFNFAWTMLLLNYDLQTQLEILKNVRFSWFFIVFIVGAALVLVLFYNSTKKRRYGHEHKLYDLMLRIEKWAVRQKVSVDPSMPPLKIVDQLAQQYPQLKDYLAEFKKQYEQYVYREEKIDSSEVIRLNKEWSRQSKLVDSSRQV